MYRVEVVQTNVFWFDAENAEEARRIAAEDYIWDEDQSGKDTYGVHFNIEEQKQWLRIKKRTNLGLLRKSIT